MKQIYDKDNEFGDIMIMALRYALGRMTYVSSEVPDFIKQNGDSINERICIVMLRDIDWYFKDRKRGLISDDECDFNSWIDLQNWLFKLASDKGFNVIGYLRR